MWFQPFIILYNESLSRRVILSLVLTSIQTKSMKKCPYYLL
nr:MAG TPA: hypothetical protein [Caudoviricetes sp.]